eukprot:m.240763 g.240763  ORF g.240763 m.240763 type:complete len:309 (-) comp15961_c0_seq1:218-1144(-)
MTQQPFGSMFASLHNTMVETVHHQQQHHHHQHQHQQDDTGYASEFADEEDDEDFLSVEEAYGFMISDNFQHVQLAMAAFMLQDGMLAPPDHVYEADKRMMDDEEEPNGEEILSSLATQKHSCGNNSNSSSASSHGKNEMFTFSHPEEHDHEDVFKPVIIQAIEGADDDCEEIENIFDHFHAKRNEPHRAHNHKQERFHSSVYGNQSTPSSLSSHKHTAKTRELHRQQSKQIHEQYVNGAIAALANASSLNELCIIFTHYLPAIPLLLPAPMPFIHRSLYELCDPQRAPSWGFTQLDFLNAARALSEHQ